jgi:predicted nucleic acid-binding protein
MGKIGEILQAQRIYLDANVFIYLLEGYPAYEKMLTELFSLIDNGELEAVTSELTLAETLVKPKMDDNTDLQQVYQDMFLTTSLLKVVPINTEILIEAATLRAKNRQIKLPDAIHLATAYVNQCQAFLTNDKSLKRIPDIKVIMLSDIATLLALNESE